MSDSSAQQQQQKAQQQQQQEQQEQMRRSILSQILLPEARERCNIIFIFSLLVTRISLVRPEQARGLEDWLVQGARSGRLMGSGMGGRVSEADLLRILDQISQQVKSSSPTIIVQRRDLLDDEDDF